MAWTRIEPVATITKSVDAVTVKVRKPTKTRGSALIVTIAPDRLMGGLAFWTAGARVAAMLGDGDDLGRLRAEQGDDFPLTSLGNKKTSATLILPIPQGVRQADLRRLAAKVSDYSDTWIEIELPKALLEGQDGGKGTATNVGAMAIINGGAGANGGSGTTVVGERSRQSGKTAPFRTSATAPGALRPAAGGR